MVLVLMLSMQLQVRDICTWVDMVPRWDLRCLPPAKHESCPVESAPADHVCFRAMVQSKSRTQHGFHPGALPPAVGRGPG